MAASLDCRPTDDSAAATLRQLEQDRGRMLTEEEYRQMRRAIVEELARGIECRPFTLFTFVTVGLGLAGLLIVGIVIGGDLAGDYVLAFASAAALLIWGWLFRTFLRGIRDNARRPLDNRLAELQQLRAEQLISGEEYEYIRAALLMSRQPGPSA